LLKGFLLQNLVRLSTQYLRLINNLVCTFYLSREFCQNWWFLCL